jgi:hypothetical protein
MTEFKEFKLPSRELLFSLRNQIPIGPFTPDVTNVILSAKTYVLVVNYDDWEVTRKTHIYMDKDNKYVSIEEFQGVSTVSKFSTIQEMIENLLMLKGKNGISQESFDIQSNLLIGMLTSLTAEQSKKILESYTKLSQIFISNFINGIYNPTLQEHFTAYSRDTSAISFLRFIGESNCIWRVKPSETMNNLRIKAIGQTAYRNSVIHFFKEMAT